jgi:hypothetical protein
MPTATMTSDDRRIIIHQLYAACTMIIAGAALGLAGYKLADASVGATLGTAVIGAGAALLPSGAAAGAAARAFAPPTVTPSAPTTPVSPTTPPAPVADVSAALADEEPDYVTVDQANGTGTLVAGTGRQAEGDL